LIDDKDDDRDRKGSKGKSRDRDNNKGKGKRYDKGKKGKHNNDAGNVNDKENEDADNAADSGEGSNEANATVSKPPEPKPFDAMAALRPDLDLLGDKRMLEELEQDLEPSSADSAFSDTDSELEDEELAEALSGWCLFCEILVFETHPESMILEPFIKRI